MFSLCLTLLIAATAVSANKLFQVQTPKLAYLEQFVTRDLHATEGVCPTTVCSSTVGATCNATVLCAPPLTCGFNSTTFTSSCVAPAPATPAPVPACMYDENCAGAIKVCDDMTCVDNTLYLQVGETCANNIQCAGELLCENTKCALPTDTNCESYEDCAFGKSCVEGDCVTSLADGATCTMDEQCAMTSACIAGKCTMMFSIANGASCAGTGTGNEGQFAGQFTPCANGICMMSNITYKCTAVADLPANDIGKTCTDSDDCVNGNGLVCSCPAYADDASTKICTYFGTFLNPNDVYQAQINCVSYFQCFMDCLVANECTGAGMGEDGPTKGSCGYTNCALQYYELQQCQNDELVALYVDSGLFPAAIVPCLPSAPAAPPAPTAGATCTPAPPPAAAPDAGGAGNVVVNCLFMLVAAVALAFF